MRLKCISADTSTQLLKEANKVIIPQSKMVNIVAKNNAFFLFYYDE